MPNSAGMPRAPSFIAVEAQPLGRPSPAAELEEVCALVGGKPEAATRGAAKPAEAVPPGRCRCLCTGIVVGVNFGTSILLVNLVKYMYVAFKFEFPLFVSAVHMAFSWALTAAMVHSAALGGPAQDGKALLSIAVRARKVLPFSIFNAASIACANKALTYIYPSFHVMIQSSTPFFTLLAAVLLEGRRFNWWAYVAMAPLCGGTLLSARGEANFSWPGALLSLGAMVMRAQKTVMQGRVLCDEDVDSVTLCYYMAPFNLGMFALGSLVYEGTGPQQMLAEQASPRLFLALAVSGGLACSFNVASYLTIRQLSAVGASVIQNAKTPATILVSLLIFGNAVTARQLLGFGATLFGVWLYGRKGRPVSDAAAPL